MFQFQFFVALNIQLRFNGIPNCGQYTLLDPIQKISDITSGLTQGVEMICGCGFSNAFVSNPFLKCFNEDSPQHVTYRAVLRETNNATTVQLMAYIEQWTTSTQSLVVQGFSLGINTTCAVVILSIDSPECLRDIDPLPGDSGGIIGGVVAGVFVLVVIVAAVIVIALVGVRCRKTGSKDVQNNKTRLVFL